MPPKISISDETVLRILKTASEEEKPGEDSILESQKRMLIVSPVYQMSLELARENERSHIFGVEHE